MADMKGDRLAQEIMHEWEDISNKECGWEKY